MRVYFSPMSRFEPYVLAVLRIVTAYAYLLNGTTKLFGIPMSEHPMPEVFSFMWTGSVLEVVLGVMLLIGFQTRLAAFISSGMMAVAYFGFHAQVDNFWLPLNNEGEAAVLYCFIFLYLWVLGRWIKRLICQQRTRIRAATKLSV